MARHIIKSALLAIMIASSLSGTVSAQEVTTYTYDTHGRLIGVARSGGPSGGVTTTYTYDAADNRTNVTVTGSRGGNPGASGDGAAAPPSQLILLPLLGGAIVFTN